ncbi:MAG: hypothetical protein GF383_00330 [Candidatus Lokiarchaeota archaeon]|nr:hypothetical protein [Candidatus Lokiarchaeota archaeon]MBD3337589.1 hypothetical protein [Candidatus Lokiarchaeota archaeon]
MIEKTREIMKKLGIKGEIFAHPEIDGIHSETVAKKLGVPLRRIIKCLILKSKRGESIAAVLLGEDKLDINALEIISGCKKLSFASEGLVLEKTGFRVGGIPPFAVIGKMPVFVDKKVLEVSKLIGSGGTRFHGLKFNSKVFNHLDCKICDISKGKE